MSSSGFRITTRKNEEVDPSRLTDDTLDADQIKVAAKRKRIDAIKRALVNLPDDSVILEANFAKSDQELIEPTILETPGLLWPLINKIRNFFMQPVAIKFFGRMEHSQEFVLVSEQNLVLSHDESPPQASTQQPETKDPMLLNTRTKERAPDNVNFKFNSPEPISTEIPRFRTFS